MLKKMVDGKEIICPPEEEALIRKKWALNEAHPEYHGHLMFDGVSEPVHDMAAALQAHRVLIQSEIEKKLEILADLIEKAEELNSDADRRLLISRRKFIKSLLDYSEDSLKKIEDLSAHLREVKNTLPWTSSKPSTIEEYRNLFL